MTGPRLTVHWPAFLAVNLSAVIFGASALFGKLDASPAWITAGRAAFAAALLGLVALARREPLALTPAQLRLTLLSGALLAAHWMLFFLSAQQGGVAVAAVTVSTFTLFTVLIEAARRRRLPSAPELAAALAVIAAVALIAGPGADPGAPRPALGVAAGLGAAAVFGLFPLVSQDLARDLPTLTVSFHQNWAVALFAAPALAFTRPLHTPADWAAVAVLGLVGTALAHQLLLFGLNRMPAAAAGALVSMEPVYAIAFAALLFGAPVGPAVFASAALIVGAALVLTRRAPAVVPPG